MRYGSVCSGIEAAGWRPSFFSEIDKFPRAVLAAHYPKVPLHGDFTTIKAGEYDPIDLLVGGTPCQSFSVAGLRGGLADDRGNLALEYLRLAQRLRPKWLVWENVPGVLSSAGGRDFGSILGGLVELGYGFAYRVLDAQFFGVPQRRRRVFVVGYLGDWRRAAAVLFERHSLSGHSPPRREAWPRVAALTANGVGTCGADDNQAQAGHLIASTGDVSHCLNAGGMGRIDYETETLISHALRADGFDASEDGTGRGTPLVAVPHVAVMPTMQNGADTPAGHNARSGDTKDAYIVPLCFNARQDPTHGPVADPLGTKDTGHGFLRGSAVRRLTPRECERLQGFPDDYTLISHRGKPAADGPRYKALGNSMAVPVMRWIGERIAMVEAAQEAA